MENRDVDVKRLSLIDVSFEDDCLINSPFSSSPFAEPSPSRFHLPDSSKADEQGFDLEGASDSNLVCSGGKTVSFSDQDPKSSEKGTTKTKKYNLRTSLAWDSEFFTSAGKSLADEQGFDFEGASDSNLVCSGGKTVSFSDQDPKSSKKEGTKKTKKYNLRTSLAWDSEFFTSAGVLDSDELSSMIEGSEKMENRSLPRILEETQRSTDSISTLESDSLTIASDALTMASLENELDELFGDVRASIQKSSRATNSIGNGIAVPVPQIHQSSKKIDLTSNGKLKPKPAPKKLSAVMAKSGRPTNQAAAHARTIQLESLHSKPPKAGNPIPAPSFTKRDSIGAHRLKVETCNAEVANSRRVSSTKTQSGVSRSILPRPSSSRYSSSSSASDKMDFMTSSVDSSVSGSSTSTEKSPMSKTDEAKPRKLSSVRSGPKTPARNVQTPIPKRVLPTTKLSTSNLSSASSTSDFSKSSTSTSTPKQKSTIPRGSSGPQKVAKEGSGVPHMPNSSRLSNDQQINGHKTQGSAQSSVRSSSTTGTMAAVSNLMKPSGLRMPSPKIGFFDGVKSGRSTNGSSPKIGKPQSARSPITNSSTRVENTKLPMSNLAPRTQEPSSLSFTEKDSDASRSAKRSPCISPKISTNAPNVEGVKSTMCNANRQETLDGTEVDVIKTEVLNARMPLTAVDSLCNMDDSLGVSAGFVAPRVEKRIESPSPVEGSLDEKSQ